jgi:hypothetical protein
LQGKKKMRFQPQTQCIEMRPTKVSTRPTAAAELVQGTSLPFLWKMSPNKIDVPFVNKAGLILALGYEEFLGGGGAS